MIRKVFPPLFNIYEHAIKALTLEVLKIRPGQESVSKMPAGSFGLPH